MSLRMISVSYLLAPSCVKRCQLRWISQKLQSQNEHNVRWNLAGIQMLSDALHSQIFKTKIKSIQNDTVVKQVKDHLHRHGLSQKFGKPLQNSDLELPKLMGENINDHFAAIANQQIASYEKEIKSLASLKSLPPLPQKWQFKRGWTKYLQDGTTESVPFPEERGLVFDVEILVKEGNYPTMATAVSTSHWYSWMSEYVIQDGFRWNGEPQLKDLIPLETMANRMTPNGGKWLPRLVIGHNVSFDRSFVKEQYFTQGTALKFLDTMSLHIAICGQTSFQRLLYQASRKDSSRKEVLEHANKQKLFKMAASEEWKKISGMNNLRDVHQLHCGGPAIEKAKRDVFVEGTMTDVRENFQDLMSYCASDVVATHQVFAQLWPQFKERFPHPVTLSGMLEMGSAYLPINDAWPRYLYHANHTYDEMERELKKLLIDLANDACRLTENEGYKRDPWLWDLDWSVSKFRLNKNANDRETTSDSDNDDNGNRWAWYQASEGEEAVDELKKTVEKIYSTAAYIPQNPTFMPGYPAWYKDLCPRPREENFYPGPSKISTQCRVTPKLMRLTWEGYPLHYHDKYGWGYLVPHLDELSPLEVELKSQEEGETQRHPFPLQEFLGFVAKSNPSHFTSSKSSGRSISPYTVFGSDFDKQSLDEEEKIKHFDTHFAGKNKKKAHENSLGPYNIDIPGVRFFKIPHKEGSTSKVGNPLAKDFISRVEDGTLQASTGVHASRALALGKMCSYWKNNQKRISGQMVVQLQRNELNKSITRHSDFDPEGVYGAIVPRIVSAGTITRRAVEPTWLTASNAYEDRIGSELKSMIQCPPGYHFVGADVDSQELWIAAVLADANFMKEHGCTAVSWMTLQGNQADKTDFHSKTAEMVNISRDHAKVLNYGRIYGAGQRFAEQLLMQFNPQLSRLEAKRKAATMYKQTKGVRNAQKKWIGGTESFMFNALESIANSENPLTPVLGCRISKALEPRYVLDDFLTSRVNWVVQSSAVDYLHLMLVCMRWLFSAYNIQGRFCVSIHDEVRYLVASEDRYRAALALQITNLLTRSMFSHQLGMNDLPQSVAFFSAVDIDKCLRKEVTFDCKTPSNPHGLQSGYSISPGEALDIHQIIMKTEGKLQNVPYKRQSK